MTHKRSFFLSFGFLALCVAPAALADTLNFSLTNPTQTGPEGSVFTYEATVSAPITNGAVVYLNGDSSTVQSGPLTVDDSDFANFPFYLDPGQSFTGDLFTVTATTGSLGTSTIGDFVLQGGSGENIYDQLGTVDFTASVANPTAMTPEPSSVLLMATGLAGGIATLRRRRG